MADLFIFGYGSSAPPKIDISSAIVTLGSALTYTGNELAQSITSVVVNGTTLTEGTDYNVTDNTGTNAGDYTLTIMGIGAYTGIKTASWSIAKAAGSVSFSPTSLSLDSSNLTETISVTRAGNGVVSAESDDTSVATVSVSGTTVMVTAVASGSATVTVSVAAGSNHNAVSGTVGVSVTLISSTLSENSPATIQAVAQAGTGANYWSVGDKTAAISISAFANMSATSACAFIIGFNHNSSVEGTGIHFQFGKMTDGKDIAFCDTGYNSSKTSGTWFNMNNSRTNSGGWNGSRMKTVVCPAFKSALPSDWQSAIKGCKKWTDNTGGGSNTASYVTETTEEIFLLAEYEVFGTRTYANSAEKNKQQQYAYYANGNSKVKYRHDSTGAACHWWLRSPYYGTSVHFVRVLADGGVGNYSVYSSIGFAPGFIVGGAPVAKIGNIKYTDFTAALNSAINGDTIILLDDIESAESISIAKTIGIDLNGHSLSLTNSASELIKLDTSRATLTIDDTSNNHSGSINCGSNANSLIRLSNNAQLIMNNGTLTGSKNQELNLVSGTATINGGTIDSILYGITNQSTSQVNITGGKIKGTPRSVNGTPTWNITGGIFSTQPDSSWIASGYTCVSNTDPTYLYIVVANT